MPSAARPVSTKSSLARLFTWLGVGVGVGLGLGLGVGLARLFTCRSIEPTFERAGAELAAALTSGRRTGTTWRRRSAEAPGRWTTTARPPTY